MKKGNQYFIHWYKYFIPETPAVSGCDTSTLTSPSAFFSFFDLFRVFRG